MNNSYNYYIGVLDSRVHTVEKIYSDVESGTYSDLDINFFKSNKIVFLCGSIDKTSDSITSNVSKFKKLSSILSFLVIEFFLDDFDNGSIYDMNTIFGSMYLDQILDEFFIIRENKKTKKFTFVNKKEIENCINLIKYDVDDLLDAFDEDYEENYISDEFSENFDNKFNEFISKIEFLFSDNKNAQITIISENGLQLDFNVFKKNSKLHKYFKKNLVVQIYYLLILI